MPATAPGTSGEPGRSAGDTPEAVVPITPLNSCCRSRHDCAARSSPNRPAAPRKKRANHNELERRRRNLQKDVMGELRDVIPILGTDKPSTVVTLTKGAAWTGIGSRWGGGGGCSRPVLRRFFGLRWPPAREYILLLEKRAAEQEGELAHLRKELKLGPAPRSGSSAAAASAAPAATSAAVDQARKRANDVRRRVHDAWAWTGLRLRCACDVALCAAPGQASDQLRRDNEALRQQILEAERRVQQQEAALAASDAAAAGSAGMHKVTPDMAEFFASVDPSLLSAADRALAAQ